jgi:hypothetical protein
MIHGLVITTHLEDESQQHLTSTCSFTLLLVFLTLKPELLSSTLSESPCRDVGKTNFITHDDNLLTNDIHFPE